jgi:hypothetical protein
MPGITINAGKVILLKVPKTRRNPRTMLEAIADRFWKLFSKWFNVERAVPTFSLTMRSITTRLQRTRIVSTEFEKVCV